MVILVLEDHPLVASGFEAVLTSQGHEVLGPAETVTQALCLAEQTSPDLALVDITLGADGNGVDAARELRQRWGIPCLLVSAQSGAARAHERRLSGTCKSQSRLVRCYHRWTSLGTWFKARSSRRSPKAWSCSRQPCESQGYQGFSVIACAQTTGHSSAFGNRFVHIRGP